MKEKNSSLLHVFPTTRTKVTSLKAVVGATTVQKLTVKRDKTTEGLGSVQVVGEWKIQEYENCHRC